MTVISSTDLLVRLQRLGCCIGTKTDKLATQLSLTGQCSKQQFQTLRLLIKYAEILESFIVDNEELNCISEVEMNQIFEQISKICNISFKPLGYVYKQAQSNADVRVLTTGETRITTQGDERNL